MFRHPHRRLLAGTLAAVAALGLVACGDDDDTATPARPVATAPTGEPPPAPPTATAPPATAPATTSPHTGHPAGSTIAVDAVDYAFEDLPAAVPAGTTLTLTNNSARELHEVVAFRLPDTETRPVDELLALPPDELEAAVVTGPPALVMLAKPGEPVINAVGDGTLHEPGRYVLLCAIPIGIDPDVYLNAPPGPDGAPQVPEGSGPPHFTAGMYAELVVE